MKKISGIRGMQIACQELCDMSKDNNKKGKIIIGITGPVASGKTRFAQELTRQIGTIGQKPIIPLPFDLWINPQGLRSCLYEGRFFLEDFKAAIRCAREDLHFLIPRYDLHRQKWIADCQHVRPTTQSVFWEGRTFDKIEPEENVDLPGASGIYLESSTGRVYSFFPNDKWLTYVADGTLVAQKDLWAYYDLLIFITAPWVNRVANMVRRFNRNEVFGLTVGSMSAYVEFLIDEARACADKEIFNQLDQKIIKVEYSPMTLSNYLDLWYLKEFVLCNTEFAHWVEREEIDHAINQFAMNLRGEYDPATMKKLRNELEHLILAKHLLCLKNKDEILKELSVILK